MDIIIILESTAGLVWQDVGRKNSSIMPANTILFLLTLLLGTGKSNAHFKSNAKTGNCSCFSRIQDLVRDSKQFLMSRKTEKTRKPEKYDLPNILSLQLIQPNLTSIRQSEDKFKNKIALCILMQWIAEENPKDIYNHDYEKNGHIKRIINSPIPSLQSILNNSQEPKIIWVNTNVVQKLIRFTSHFPKDSIAAIMNLLAQKLIALDAKVSFEKWNQHFHTEEFQSFDRLFSILMRVNRQNGLPKKKGNIQKESEMQPSPNQDAFARYGEYLILSWLRQSSKRDINITLAQLRSKYSKSVSHWIPLLKESVTQVQFNQTTSPNSVYIYQNMKIIAEELVLAKNIDSVFKYFDKLITENPTLKNRATANYVQSGQWFDGLSEAFFNILKYEEQHNIIYTANDETDSTISKNKKGTKLSSEAEIVPIPHKTTSDTTVSTDPLTKDSKMIKNTKSSDVPQWTPIKACVVKATKINFSSAEYNLGLYLMFVFLNSYKPESVLLHLRQAGFYGTDFLDNWIFVKGALFMKYGGSFHKKSIEDKYIKKNIETISEMFSKQQLDCIFVTLGNTMLEYTEMATKLTKILSHEKISPVKNWFNKWGATLRINNEKKSKSLKHNDQDHSIKQIALVEITNEWKETFLRPLDFGFCILRIWLSKLNTNQLKQFFEKTSGYDGISDQLKKWFRQSKLDKQVLSYKTKDIHSLDSKYLAPNMGVFISKLKDFAHVRLIIMFSKMIRWHEQKDLFAKEFYQQKALDFVEESKEIYLKELEAQGKLAGVVFEIERLFAPFHANSGRSMQEALEKYRKEPSKKNYPVCSKVCSF